MGCLKLSLCMIVKNEAGNLEALLPQVQECVDEIIIVDTGSDDYTLEVARHFTPNVYSFPWCDDFSAARNYSLAKASGEYFLWFDADDRLTHKSIQGIRRLKEYLDGEKFFYFVLKDMRETEKGPCVRSYTYQIRCAPRHPSVRFKGRIHENLTSSLTSSPYVAVNTDIEIEHYGYNDPKILRAKMQRNLRLFMEDYKSRSDDATFVCLLANTYAMLGHYNEASRVICEFLTTHYPHVIGKYGYEVFELFMLIVEYEVKQNKLDDAKRWLIKAEACRRDDLISYYRLGLLWENLGDHRKATMFFYQVPHALHHISTFPTLAPPEAWEVHLHLAFNFLCMGREERFHHHIDIATKYEGVSLTEAYEWLGTHALLLRRFSIANLILEEAVSCGYATASILCNAGVAHMEIGNLRKAENYFKSCLQKELNFSQGLMNLGWLYICEGRFLEAHRIWNNLLMEGKTDWDVAVGGLVSAILSKHNIAYFKNAIKKKLSEDYPESIFKGDDLIGLLDTLIRVLQHEGRTDLVSYISSLRRNLLKSYRHHAE